MSGTSYKHKSGAPKQKEKEKSSYKNWTHFVRRPGDEPDFFVGSDSGPPKLPAQPGSQVNYRQPF